MDENRKKIVTFNVRKTQRFESKKRKIEALLNLFQKEKSAVSKSKKKKNESLEESYKDLKDELKRYLKKPEFEPNFYLAQPGLRAEVSIDCSEANKDPIEPLFVEDIYLLLLRSAIGHHSPYPLHWAKLERPQNVAKTVLLVIEGVAKSNVIENWKEMSAVAAVFPHVVVVASANVPFAAELCSLHCADLVRGKKVFSPTAFSRREEEVRPAADRNQGEFSKLHLLLSPIQMAMENYPLPQSVFEPSRSEGYTYSRESYSPVTGQSPLFAVDCEMCVTGSGKSELTRIAVVDENLEVVYHTLVMPHDEIVNYLTRFSGITAPMLQGVQTRLKDVQAHLRAALPADAILCGQSLNNDLHALRLIHPYVVDTSVIFNSCGLRSKKDSLRSLAQLHLGERIQVDTRAGHHPAEDATAAMKLVKLKLAKGIKFGDVCFFPPSRSHTDADGFFARITKLSKKACLIGPQETLDHYNAEFLTSSVKKVVESCHEKILKATKKHTTEFDVVVSHLTYDSSSSVNTFQELNSVIEQIYDACGDRTLFAVLFSGADASKFEDIKTGLFMATLKKC